MKRIAILITMLLAVITASAQEEDKLYDGKIGDFNIKVSINLRDVVDAAVGDSVGYYFYNDRPKTKFTLRLKELDEDMNENSFRVSYHIILDEHTPKGFNSGSFDGWVSALSNYSGTFKNSQGKEFDYTWDVFTIDD